MSQVLVKTTRTLMLMLMLLISTTTVSCTSVREGVHRTKEAAADILIPPSQEERLGEQMAAQVESEARLHADPQVQQYIQRLGARVAQDVDVPGDLSLKFKVIDDPGVINAMALPGGWIYVYSGLLLAAEDEAEVAGVIGHEIAHVTERHIAERLVTAYGLAAVEQMVLGQNAGLLASLVTELLEQGYMLQHSRTAESEADDVGVRYVIDAGYDPMGMVRFFEKLNRG